MTLTLIGIILTTFGLIWTIYGVFSNRKIKKLIISEKNMILDKVSDLKIIMQAHLNKLIADRKIQNNQTLNNIIIREEDIKAIKEILGKFEDRLKSIK